MTENYENTEISAEIATQGPDPAAPPVLPYYQCQSIVQAVRITAIDVHYNRVSVHYHLAGGFQQMDLPLDWYNRVNPQQGGYLVIPGNLEPEYVSDGRFESEFKPLSGEGIDFSDALALIKQGRRCSRIAWPPGQFVFLVPGSHFEVNRAPLLGIYPEGTAIDYHGHIDIRDPALGEIYPWTPGQADQLAEDWTIYE